MMMRRCDHVPAHGSFLHAHHAHGGRLHHYRWAQAGHALLLAAALHDGLLAVMAVRHLDEGGHRFRLGHHHDRLLGDNDHVLLVNGHHGHHLLLNLGHDHLFGLGFRLHDLLLLDHGLDHWFHGFLLLSWLDDVHVGLGRWARWLGRLDHLQRGLGRLDRRLDHAQSLDWRGDRLDVEGLDGLWNGLDVQRLDTLRYGLDVEGLHGRLGGRLDAVGLRLRKQACRVQTDYRLLRPVLILPGGLLDLQILLLQRLFYLRRGDSLGQGQTQQQKGETDVETHLSLCFFDLLLDLSVLDVQLWRLEAIGRFLKETARLWGAGSISKYAMHTQRSWLCGIPRVLRHLLTVAVDSRAVRETIGALLCDGTIWTIPVIVASCR